MTRAQEKFYLSVFFLFAVVLLGMVSMLYIKTHDTSAEAAIKDKSFIDGNACVLNNWEIIGTTETNMHTKAQTHYVHLKSISGDLNSNNATPNADYATLKNRGMFIYECEHNQIFKSNFGFFTKVTNTKSAKNIGVADL